MSEHKLLLAITMTGTSTHACLEGKRRTLCGRWVFDAKPIDVAWSDLERHCKRCKKEARKVLRSAGGSQ